MYAKLQTQIDAAVAKGVVSETIRNDEAMRELPYLQACIKEGLRVFPPITALRERVTPPEGDVISGYKVPGGVNIGLNMRGVLLSEVFGPDPDVYRPERWLEATPEKLNEMKSVQELVFGHGFTRCLGINVATMNLNKALVEVRAYPQRNLCFSSLTVHCIAFETLQHFGGQPHQAMEKSLPWNLLSKRVLRPNQPSHVMGIQERYRFSSISVFDHVHTHTHTLREDSHTNNHQYDKECKSNIKLCVGKCKILCL